MWFTWPERTRRIFEYVEVKKEWVWERMKFFASLWATTLTQFKGLWVADI